MKRLLLILLLAACADEPRASKGREHKGVAPQLCLVTIPGVGNLGKSRAGTFEYCLTSKRPVFVLMVPDFAERSLALETALKTEVFGARQIAELRWPEGI